MVDWFKIRYMNVILSMHPVNSLEIVAMSFSVILLSFLSAFFKISSVSVNDLSSNFKLVNYVNNLLLWKLNYSYWYNICDTSVIWFRYPIKNVFKNISL